MVFTFVSALMLAFFLAYLQWSGNFHPVFPGEAYRSAQPTPAQIRAYSRNFGIKTIINLRGAERDASWYRAEAREATRLAITLIDFPMSAGKKLSKEKILQIISILRRAQKLNRAGFAGGHFV